LSDLISLPEKCGQGQRRWKISVCPNKRTPALLPGFQVSSTRDGNDIRRSEAEQAFDGNDYATDISAIVAVVLDTSNARLVEVTDFKVQAEI
jgi:hypothetical protein